MTMTTRRKKVHRKEIIIACQVLVQIYAAKEFSCHSSVCRKAAVVHLPIALLFFLVQSYGVSFMGAVWLISCCLLTPFMISHLTVLLFRLCEFLCRFILPFAAVAFLSTLGIHFLYSCLTLAPLLCAFNDCCCWFIFSARSERD